MIVRVLAHRVAASVLVCWISCISSSAAAQPVLTTGRPPVTWIGLGRPGDSTGGAGDIDRMGELALEPLRLSLLGSQALAPSGPCLDQNAEAKTGSGGFRLMGTTAMNVNLFGSSSKAPRLTLFGFSRMGCTLDAAIGGGATFVVPIKKDVAFVLSGGAIYLPKTTPGIANPNGGPTSSSSVRADVVFQRANGRSLSVGVGTLPLGVAFGGVW